jgi:pyruvate dehydrogenase E2 component (dihydrolipoamide acetyltransferase)
MGGDIQMTVRIEMPQLSAEGESGALASWLVKAGDEIEVGEVIAELETDKSTLELEAPASGTLLEIVVAAGTEDIAPGTLLALIEADAAASDTPRTPGTSDPSESLRPDPAGEEAAASASQSAALSETHGPASTTSAPLDRDAGRASTPLARRAAENRGLELSALEGSGPGGRILEADVLRTNLEGEAPTLAADRPPLALTSSLTSSGSASSAEGAEGVEIVRLSAMRKTIARRMTESKQQIPHFYLSARCGMDEVLEIRARLNAELSAANRDIKISVNDFIVRAAALALREVPAANVSFAGDTMHVFERVDISVAVATDGGLVTPVVRSADRKGLTTLAEEVKELAQRARSGSLRPEEYRDGTFTISNLGMYGIESVYPILNPPQACILGVGAAEEEPVVRDGEIRVGRIASITLAADHRAVDGAVGAQLLAAIRTRLEDPLAMLL